MNSTLPWAIQWAGALHLVVASANFITPRILRYRENLAKLSPIVPQLTPFNRKLMWVYAGTTLLTIIVFGALTLFLHDDFLRGDRAALALAAFIAIFWTLRILVDFIYFKHAAWPTGLQFVVGHFLLTTLFVALASTYWAVLVWSLGKGRP